MVAEAAIRRRFRLIERHLDERQRRLVAAAELAAAGPGGVSAVARATGVSRRAIRTGAKELRARGAAALPPGRIRRPGGGRKRTSDTDVTLVRDLEALIAPTTRGDPQSPLRWTCKSLRRLAAELTRQGHRTSHRMVAVLLRQLGYSLQANRKTIEGARHPDRNAQFEHINARVRTYLRQGEPAISVDTKKKELVGNFQNAGRDWRPHGHPQPVQVHDFVQPELGRAIPYGVYDLQANTGWVSVGIDHDTAAFAVASIGHWWRAMGRRAYPHARRLLITADAGGSNGARVRLWKVELQKLANRLRLPISVCHFPPGTSKWNKIEHRLFSFITKNWRGRPLLSHAVIVSLIAATTTPTGLRVRARLDTRRYPSGLAVSREAVEAVQLRPDAFHGDWNYTILPAPWKNR
jgi:transposase